MKQEYRDLGLLLLLSFSFGAATGLLFTLSGSLSSRQQWLFLALYAVTCFGCFYELRRGKRATSNVSNPAEPTHETSFEESRIIESLKMLESQVQSLGQQLKNIQTASQGPPPNSNPPPVPKHGRSRASRDRRSKAKVEEPAPPKEKDWGGEASYSPRPVSGVRAGGTMTAVSTSRLIEAWDNLRRVGYFKPSLLKDELEKLNIDGKVLDHRIGESDEVLGVDLGDGKVYLLPNFTKTAKSVTSWFDAAAGSGRKSLISRLSRPAVLSSGRRGFELESRGQVE